MSMFGEHRQLACSFQQPAERDFAGKLLANAG